MSSTALALPETDWLTEAADISAYQSPYPSLTDTQRLYRFLTALAHGNYPNTAIKLAGFHTQTLYDWRTYAKAGDLAAIRLVEAMEKAEAEAEGEMVDCVRNAAKSGPQYWAAGMTYLERRQPDRWSKRPEENSGPRVLVQIGVAGQDVQVNVGLSPASPQPESETLSDYSGKPLGSEKQSYVNQIEDSKSLIAGALEAQVLPQRNQSEAHLALPAGGGPARDPGGTQPHPRAVQRRKGFSGPKGTRTRKRQEKRG